MTEWILAMLETAAGFALIVASVRHFNLHGCILPVWVDGVWATLGGAGALMIVSVAGLPLDVRWPSSIGLLAAGVLAAINRRRGDIRRHRQRIRECRDCLRRRREKGGQ